MAVQDENPAWCFHVPASMGATPRLRDMQNYVAAMDPGQRRDGLGAWQPEVAASGSAPNNRATTAFK
jgi:hypothetical protein